MLNEEKATFTPAVFLTSGGMSKAICKQSSGPHSQEKEREILRCGKACKDKNKICNVKIIAYCSTRLQRQEYGQNYETPLSEVSYNLIPAPMMEWMCIYSIVDISYIILVAVENFRDLCIVLCQLHHLI